MRLLTKNILYNTFISIAILSIGEISIYLFLKSKLEAESAQHLKIERKKLLAKMDRGIDISLLEQNIGDEIIFTPISRLEYIQPVVTNIDLDEEDEEDEDGVIREEKRFTSKRITFDAPYQGKNYRVCITKTVDEDEGLRESMMVVIVASGLLMILLLTFVNWLVYRNLLWPFNLALSRLKSFTVSDQKKIDLPSTTTYEFELLNRELEHMSKKIVDDYISLKEFTENISHEIQTPLAIISTKIEMCLQDESLSANQAELLGVAMNKIKHLAGINQSLIMLTKLQSNIYEHLELVDISDVVQNCLAGFSDFIVDKNIRLVIVNKNKVLAYMNVALAEVLFDNLIKNAVKYNFKNGKLLVEFTDNGVNISNTGQEPVRDPEKYFERFISDGKGDSMGLGLAIVKKICDTYKITINYRYESPLHVFRLVFESKYQQLMT